MMFLAPIFAEYQAIVAEPARTLQQRASVAIARIAVRYAADVTDAARR
jgi:hypothetical protein